MTIVHPMERRDTVLLRATLERDGAVLEYERVIHPGETALGLTYYQWLAHARARKPVEVK